MKMTKPLSLVLQPFFYEFYFSFKEWVYYDAITLCAKTKFNS